MIIWLASYPKSGNTWVRLFLDNLLFTNNQFDINNNFISQFPLRKHFLELNANVNDLNEFSMNCTAAQLRLNLDDKVFCKTHTALYGKMVNNFLQNEENHIGVIIFIHTQVYNFINYHPQRELIIRLLSMV